MYRLETNTDFVGKLVDVYLTISFNVSDGILRTRFQPGTALLLTGSRLNSGRPACCSAGHVSG
jgi:hypothetical protein